MTQLEHHLRAHHAEQHVVAALCDEVLAAVNDRCPELLVRIGELNRIVVDVADNAERGRPLGFLGADVLKGVHLSGHVMDDDAPRWAGAAPLTGGLVCQLCLLDGAAAALTITKGADDALALRCVLVRRSYSRSRSCGSGRRRRTGTLTCVPYRLLNGKTIRTAGHCKGKEA